MKKAILILGLLILIMIPVLMIAQPLPSDGGIGGGAGSSPSGGGAPIGGGLLILLSLAVGYGTRKVFRARKKLMN